MELTDQQRQYLFARECGTPYQRKMAAILRSSLAALVNDDKPTGIAREIDFEAEIKRFLNY